MAFSGFWAAGIFDDDDDQNVGLAGVEPDEPAPEDLDYPTPVDPEPTDVITGTAGTDDLLQGNDGDDIITGNDGDNDVLMGGDGNDILYVGSGNTADGGAGIDTFYLPTTTQSAVTIDNFDPENDEIVIEGGLYYDVGLHPNEESTGYYLLAEDTFDVIASLPNLTLSEGGQVHVDFQQTDSETGEVVSAERLLTPTALPFGFGALNGTSDAEVINGTDENDLIFGNDGADTITGGAGDDELYGGSSTVFYPSQYNHFPGRLTLVGDAGDILDGGAGNDTLVVGGGDTATGGAGADTFITFGNANPEVAQITDFTQGDDTLSVEVASTSDFTVSTAVAGFQLSYDAGSDTTEVVVGTNPVATLNGDQTALSVSFASTPSEQSEVFYLNQSGAEISQAQADAADIRVYLLDRSAIFGVAS